MSHRLVCGFWVIGLLTLLGCASKTFTPPRSQVIEEGRAAGIAMTSPDEDERAFWAYESGQRERLIELVKRRTGGEYRDPSYRLGVGDEVEVNVFDVDELNVTAKVRPSGFVSLPLVGAIKALGRTEVEFQEDLTKRLSAFVRNPQVNVFVANYGSQKVAVMGAVYRPGTFPLQKGANSILELLSQSGGVTERAGNTIIFIPAELSGISATGDVEARARLSFTAPGAAPTRESGIELLLPEVMGTAGGIPLEIPVRGGDMVILPEAGKVHIEGEVEKPGPYETGRDLTLLSALAAAGGITYSAKVDEVELVRDLPGGVKGRLIRDLQAIARGEQKDVRLKGGDLVRVPSDSGRRMTHDTFESIRGVLNFGIGGSVNLIP